jgi:hypothetical protein
MTLTTLPGILDERGNLRWVEGNETIPFEIRRVFYMTGIPVSTMRGGHAHRQCHQFIIPVVGALKVKLDHGSEELCRWIKLDDPSKGLHVLPMVWCELYNSLEGGACLILASEHYDESDYIRDYMTFLKEVKK